MMTHKENLGMTWISSYSGAIYVRFIGLVIG